MTWHIRKYDDVNNNGTTTNNNNLYFSSTMVQVWTANNNLLFLEEQWEFLKRNLSFSRKNSGIYFCRSHLHHRTRWQHSQLQDLIFAIKATRYLDNKAIFWENVHQKLMSLSSLIIPLHVPIIIQTVSYNQSCQTRVRFRCIWILGTSTK